MPYAFPSVELASPAFDCVSQSYGIRERAGQTILATALGRGKRSFSSVIARFQEA